MKNKSPKGASVSGYRNRKARNNKGFILLESIISIVIIIIIISSITLANTVAMQTNESQRKKNNAQDIANDLITQVVRNDSFDVLFDKIDENLPGNFNTPYKAELTVSELGNLVTQDQMIILNKNLKKLSKTARASIYIRPILIGTNISSPDSYSKSKINVTVKVNQDNDQALLFEVSTVVTREGFFSKSAHSAI